MAQYQSFPGVNGDSASLEKLKALRLPSLNGQSFLDVGCNEGFFCGYARFDGAGRVVGLDQSNLFLERARQRFPDCEFLQQSWDQLPQGPFDVILLASSLHYADDQPGLIHRLMEALSPDGTLVMEIGVAPSGKNEWIKVERGIDERYFPAMPKLREIFADYAWKHIGPSVLQAGDPVPRHVFHVKRRKPFAYLLLEPPAYGKSTIGRLLFQKAGIPLISGDQILLQIFQGKLAATPALERLLKKYFSRTTIDQVTVRIFKKGLEGNLFALFLDAAGYEDFALDAYIPADFHQKIAAAMKVKGYFPVFLQWDKMNLAPEAACVSGKRAEGYFKSLGESAVPSGLIIGVKGAVGFVERFSLNEGWLNVVGWAMDGSGEFPKVLEVRLGKRRISPEGLIKKGRSDVQKHFGLNHDLLGFSLRIETPELKSIGQLREDFQLFVGNSTDRLFGPLPFTRNLVKMLDNENND
ncbi:MAG: methyltransferase domain-containing protein [Deltaproteobacteria bacterium]|nr:methyltransferase domain-containing protein [Deltaproteobacteria bacterium]